MQTTESAAACVGFRSEQGDKLLIVHASNTCELKLSCTLRYSLRCEDNAGKVTARSARQVPFTLAAKGDADITLSAAACKQGWSIDDVAWTCA